MIPTKMSSPLGVVTITFSPLQLGSIDDMDVFLNKEGAAFEILTETSILGIPNDNTSTFKGRAVSTRCCSESQDESIPLNEALKLKTP
jgi:hypothetical protein